MTVRDAQIRPVLIASVQTIHFVATRPMTPFAPAQRQNFHAHRFVRAAELSPHAVTARATRCQNPAYPALRIADRALFAETEHAIPVNRASPAQATVAHARGVMIAVKEPQRLELSDAMTPAARPVSARMTPTAVRRVTTRCVQESRRQEPAAESARAVEPHQPLAVVLEIVGVRVPMDAGAMNPVGASRIAAAMSVLCAGSATVSRSKYTVA